MNLEIVKSLIASGKSDIDIANALIGSGIKRNHSILRKGVGVVRLLLANATDEKGRPRSLNVDVANGKSEELFTVDNPPTTLQDALLHSKADLSVWEVEKWIWNHWAGFYQVKIFFKQRNEQAQARVQKILAELKQGFAQAQPTKSPGSGIALVAMADFHYGMSYQGDAKNPSFSIASLTASVRAAADKINALGLDQVHLALLGDFIESFTGLNHLDTWKNLETYGRDAVKGVSEMLRDELILRVNNVAGVYIVPGNHDRTSLKSDVDGRGEAGRLVADFLELMVRVPVHFNFTLLNPKIDGVKYILTHGHLGVSKIEAHATILEHGDQSCYNVLLNAHGHTKTAQTTTKVAKYVTDNVIALEGSNYIKMQIAPMVSGGAYSTSIGGYSSCGFTVVRAATGGKVDVLLLSS